MKRSDSHNEIWDVAVIGGGPAGMMAAGRAAEKGARVVLLEKNPNLGKKLLITGGGRCNVTNAEFDDRKLLAHFKDAGKYLFSAFARWNVKNTLDFFESRGMPTKVEPGQRVFPASDSARSVLDVLVAYIKAGNVTIMTKAEIIGFEKEEKGGANIITAAILKGQKEKIRARSFILATGGTSHPETGSTGEGFSWLADLGHQIVTPAVSLVPIKLSDSWVPRLQGVSLQNVKCTLDVADQTNRADRTARDSQTKFIIKKGKILFTHFGISGPSALNMSSEARELLKYGDVVISLDLLPELDYAALNTALQRVFSENSNKKLKNSLDALIAPALVPVVCELSGIDGDTWCHSVTREQRLALVTLLKDIPLHVSGFLGADRAIVTSGGVSLDEVDFKTMRSRRIANLYLVGDTLDIDRPSGGYSLQLCWTTGFVAGDAVATVL